MLQYTLRFHVEEGREREFVAWLEANEQSLANYSRRGWTYLGTWKSVLFLSTHDYETRFELEDYAALGQFEMDDEAMRITVEYLSFLEGPIHATLGRPAAGATLIGPD